MNLKLSISKSNRAVALVITLLMLSVITFLAVAFLSMTRRDKSAVTASLDIDNARNMSEAALARAQAGIVAQMMSAKDILSYDYSVSHNYITTNGFTAGVNGFTNVNYDLLSGSTDPSWAQNIANLFYDPRPPVFVMTNGDQSRPSNDFRYWVDLNRNGKFESNGVVQMFDTTGALIPGVFANYNGEPEWIGVLKYPETNHSAINPFIGRYAFMVLPIGKTLDFNFIHNFSKKAGNSGLLNSSTAADYFTRNEGVGSWELNLAALLNDINVNMYPPVGGYSYDPTSPTSANGGLAFDDAVQFVRYRYSGYQGNYPLSLFQSLGKGMTDPTINSIDEYGIGVNLSSPFDYTASGANPVNTSWPGSYNTNMYYDVQDLFDVNKTGSNNLGGFPFATRFAAYNSQKDSYDRYTMQRLLSSIGMSSAPEYGVFVYSNGFTTNLGTAPTWFRTKVNINYDNSPQIQAGPYSPMPTNLAPWDDPLKFFTNTADLLLRSQEFVVTTGSGPLVNHFGITNILIYNPTNASYSYNAKIHRMLQLAANIYEVTSTNFVLSSGQRYYTPHTYRPLFSISNGFVSIVGYTNVSINELALGAPYYDLTDSNNIQTAVTSGKLFNIWGIPWIVGTVKGLPSFNKFTSTSRYIAQREVLFFRDTESPGKAITNQPPKYTNQFHVFTVSNFFAMDAWNPYSTPYPFPVSIFASNYVTVLLTNNYDAFYTNNFIFVTNVSFNGGSWPAWANQNGAGGFISLLQTNVVSIAPGFISDVSHKYILLDDFLNSAKNGALPPDATQSAGPAPNFPVHTWTITITNHVVYYMSNSAGQLLDFVNLGPFGGSNQFWPPVSQPGGRPSPDASAFVTTGATDAGGFSAGLKYQITNGIALNQGVAYGGASGGTSLLKNSIYGTNQTYGANVFVFGLGYNPSNLLEQKITWVANDPLVHYTIDDLYWPAGTAPPPTVIPYTTLLTALSNNTDFGKIVRYDPWPTPNPLPGSARSSNTRSNMLLKDPLIYSPNQWNFPTNLLPGVGWLGRIHRGTPWQTVFLKSDNPTSDPQPRISWNNWVNTPTTLDPSYTYPTNDWSLIDLFTTAPNDNALRGTLSVNQTNDAAWAAVFAGVIAPTSASTYATVNPTNDIYYMMDYTNDITVGINQTRMNTNLYPNGIFHHIGDILSAPTLTAQSPYVTNAGITTLSDDIVERIPQQTLSLLKVGLPQFVIYAWGQSLRPKSLDSGTFPGLCTNYEITGEFLTRTVCHVVSDPGATAPKIVVDNYNIPSGN